MQQKSAKIFINGKNQAVRLPKDFEFQGVDEVIIRKEGNSLVITPAKLNWMSFADLPAADDDFMSERIDIFNDKRVEL